MWIPTLIANFIGLPTTLALSVTTARVALEARTTYRVWSSVDCFIMFGDVTVEATTTSHPLTAKCELLYRTSATETYVAGIVSSGTGQLFISKVAVKAAPWAL